MKFKIYRQYSALNSLPVLNAVEAGLKRIGHTIVEQEEDIPIIWSVLWQGRMALNRSVFENCKKNNRPIIIIEVGNLIRNVTWRVSLNHVNALGIFPNKKDLDTNRPKILNLSLKKSNLPRKKEIIVACQHQRSLQWEGLSTTENWINDVINEVRRYSDRPIIIRPHPRSPISFRRIDVKVEIPQKIQNSYDNFDINYDYHCLINHNSGPAIQAAINGTPVICDRSSLAFPVSDSIKNIENINLPDREIWFLEICHTEWLVEEISKGIPFLRLQPEIENFFS
jgi:hypothetical protein